MLPHSKFSLLVTCLLFSSLSLYAQSPNIVIIICDDLNDSIEGIGGHPQAYTPNIDRLRGSGVTFLNAASNAPICGPSRASLWSGIHPINSGMYGASQQNNRWYNNVVLSSKKTLFEHFIDQGYYSYATGKIHHNGHEQPYSTIMRNDDNTIGFEGQGKYKLSGNINNSLPGSFGPYPNNGTNPIHNGINPPWWPSYSSPANPGPPYSGYGYYRDISSYGAQWTNQTGGANNANFTNWNVGYKTPDEICAEQAVNFISSYNENKPFLLTVGFVRPHSPYYAPQEFFEAPYVPALNDVQLSPINPDDYNDITGPVNADDKDLAQTSGWYKNTTYRNMGSQAYGDDEYVLREFTQAYLACVAFVDAQVGKILDVIESSTDDNIKNNTLIIFTSDHGYHLGEKEYIFKQSPWEESVRVPFVVSGPGVASNKVCEQPISLVDVYPTCVDFADIEAPHILDGHSIKPLLEDPENGNGWTGTQYSVSGIGSSETVSQNQVAPYEQQHFSIRSSQYRYIYYRNGEEELYDHSTDPNEWTNLVNSPSHLDALQNMRSYYRYAVGLEEPPAQGPSFYFIKPSDGEGFFINEPIMLEASGININLSSVEFYIGENLLKVDSIQPYTTSIYNASEGTHILSAIGKQLSGDELSAQININVSNSNNSPNLISNSGFEASSLDSDLGSFGSSISISNDYSATGSQSLLIDKSDSGSWRGVKYDLINLEEGETYEFSAKVYLEQSSDRVSLTTKKTSTNNYTWPAEITDPQVGTWLELTGQITYDSSLMDFIYIAGVDDYENFYVDDISISKIGGPLVNPEDTDGDGMLDSWEQQFLVPLGLSDIAELLPNEDSDGDGATNVEEYRSDTLPFNPFLSFKVTDCSYDTSNFQCEWRGSPNKDYRVLSTTDLEAGNWSVVEEALPGSLTYINTWTDSDQVSEGKFYKIEIDD